MTDDERAIRELVDTWLKASWRGDLDRVLELMAQDVVFLAAGRPPMRGRDAFASASRAIERGGRVEGGADIQEIRVFGDWAYCWNQLTITMYWHDGETVHLAGPALSVLRRNPDGSWVIYRDANMLAPVKEGT